MNAIVKTLNALLKIELTATTAYLLYSQIAANLGYAKFSEQMKTESAEEQQHAKWLTERIVQLDGTPELQTETPAIPLDIPSMLKQSRGIEEGARDAYNAAIESTIEDDDHGTRVMLDEIQDQTEEHIRWLIAQQNLIDQVGLQNYLTLQA